MTATATITPGRSRPTTVANSARRRTVSTAAAPVPDQAEAMARQTCADARTLQRMGVQALTDELERLTALRGHDEASEQAAAATIGTLTDEITYRHRQVVRAEAVLAEIARPLPGDAAARAVSAGLRSVLAALHSCSTSRRPVRRRAPTECLDRPSERAAVDCCRNLDEALRMARWNLNLVAMATGAPATTGREDRLPPSWRI